MILILHADTDKNGTAYRHLLEHLSNLPNITARVHDEVGTRQTLSEIYLVGDTATLQLEDMASLPCRGAGGAYPRNTVSSGVITMATVRPISNTTVCASGRTTECLRRPVCRRYPERCQNHGAALQERGLPCHMGAYKPRTNPIRSRGTARAACRLCSSWPAGTASRSSPWK
jgi:3-deoxy-7-phosphoheptulonate synthase